MVKCIYLSFKRIFFIKRNYKGLKDKMNFMSTRLILNVGNSDSKGYFQ